MLNQITIMGRLTRDPELRHTASNIPVASFSVAMNRDYKDKETGERETDFIDVVAWRGTGEFVSNYLSKGSMVVVNGRLTIRPWEDQDGNKRRSAEIVAENVYFAESKKSDGNAQGETPKTAPKTTAKKTATPPPDELNELEDDGDLPF